MVAMLTAPRRAKQETGAERRNFGRREVHSRVQGKRMDHSVDALQMPYVSLALRDLSVGGLSAIAQMPLMKGEEVAVFFPPEGAHRGWDVKGRVVRCEPSTLGFRVALEFNALPFAA